MQVDAMTTEAVDEHKGLITQFRAYDADGSWTDLEREAFGRAMAEQESRLVLIAWGNRWSVRFNRRGPPRTERQIREFKADLMDTLRLVSTTASDVNAPPSAIDVDQELVALTGLLDVSELTADVAA